jgi:GT2 family glycosyltransferase
MRCKLTVGIPTIGRAPVLLETLRELKRQTRPADSVIVCGTTQADVDGAADIMEGVTVLLHEPGLPRQRNAVMAAAADADIVVFFDDDFLPDRGYLAAIEALMARDDGIVVATGTVVADDICGPGLSVLEGRAILQHAPATSEAVESVFAGYGCNMAIRCGAMRQNNLTFDERLPLYGWQEDVDLSRRLAAFGTIVRTGAARGVHLGVKLGRGSGVRLGYSQIANPLYLANKKTGYPLSRAVRHLVRNMAMNVMRSAWPEPYIDRRGRLRGNILALRDLIGGRMDPERVCEL